MTLTCVECRTPYYRKPSQVKRLGSSYCSRQCMASGYVARLTGAANPHFKNLERTCEKCSALFRSYNKGQRTCSQSCGSAMSQLRHPRGIALKPVPRLRFVGPRGRRLSCKRCKEIFYWGCRRKLYCSVCYETKNVRECGRKDANHDDIAQSLEAAGAVVFDLSRVGGGCPDMVVSAPGGRWILLEVKNPNNSYGRKLRQSQVDFHAAWSGGPIVVVRTTEEALAAVGIGA